MDSEKRAHQKTISQSSSDPVKDTDKQPNSRPRPRPSKKRPHGKNKKGKADSSDEHSGRGMAAARDKHAAEFGSAGEWPVALNNDSAGPPVRKEPSLGRLQKDEGKKKDDGGAGEKKRDSGGRQGEGKKESGKRPKASKKRTEKEKQPPSSDNKPSERVSEGECTTKRNLHLIKTERAGKKTSSDHSSDEKEDEKKRKKKKEKKSKKRSKEKAEGGEEGKKAKDQKKKEEERKKVERESIHLAEQQQQKRPKVERVAIPKPEGWHDVEREPLYNFIPSTQYDNLPEDSLMKALKPPPVNPNSNPFTPQSDLRVQAAAAAAGAAPSAPRVPNNNNTTTITEPTTEKKATEREKREQRSAGTTWSEVSEMQKTTMAARAKRGCKNPPWCVWIWVAGLFLICCALLGLVYGAVQAQNESLKRHANHTSK